MSELRRTELGGAGAGWGPPAHPHDPEDRADNREHHDPAGPSQAAQEAAGLDREDQSPRQARDDRQEDQASEAVEALADRAAEERETVGVDQPAGLAGRGVLDAREVAARVARDAHPEAVAVANRQDQADPEARSDQADGDLEHAASADLEHDQEQQGPDRGIPPVTERLSRQETTRYQLEIQASQQGLRQERAKIVRRADLARRPTLTPETLADITAVEVTARQTFTTKQGEMVAAELAAAERIAAERAAWAGREAGEDAADREVIAAGPGGRFAGHRRAERLDEATERVQGRVVTDDRYRQGEAEHRQAADRLTTDPLTGRAIDPAAQTRQAEASDAYRTAERARQARLDHDQAVTINARLDRRRDKELGELEPWRARINQRRQALAERNAWRADATPEQIAAADKERDSYINGRGRSTGRDDYDRPVLDDPRPGPSRPGPSRTPDPYYHHEIYEPRQDRGIER